MGEEKDVPQKNSAQQAEEKAKEAMNTAKDTASLAKNAASGNYIGAAKDTVNLLKNKKVRRKIIINFIMQLLVPILILLFIAGIFMAVIQGIGSAIGDGIEAVGGWFAGDSVDTSGNTYSITINNDKFEEIVASMAAQGINAESSSLTEECLKLFILAQYRTQYPKDVKIRIEVSDEEKQKIEARSNRFGRPTNLVNEDGKNYLKTEGCIHLYRPEFTNDELRYIQREELDKYLNGEKSFDDVKKYYTLEGENLILPQKKIEKYIQGEDEREDAPIDLNQEDDGYDWESFNNRTPTRETVTPSLIRVPYQTQIASYSMPMEFLTILTSFTQNSEYGVALARLVDNSNTKINILDESVTTEERYVHQYKSHTKVKFFDGTRVYLPIYSDLWVEYSGNIRDYYVTEERLWRPNRNQYIATENKNDYRYIYEKETPRIYRENTITTEYTAKMQLAEASGWFSRTSQRI